ncbi:ligand-binding sensor domain-containing protein [Algoriphagus confluentis]|uniref:Ligand-binding sensor domain-containing protein n=1 Tax=Algoriphagus confluentis TaxID=1697556 RepID=A0ABQ6PJC1_9BACT|nr:hypothetical protein Aconfl_04700 [Algoriphagus confluentis]
MIEAWDNTNGLPQNMIFALEKDNHGYLWASTEEGLVRLDGASLKVFDQQNYPQMLEQTYYSFYKSPTGIWASADRSIALLEKNILKIIDCTSITDNTWIRALIEVGKDNLLIGTDLGDIYEWKEDQLEPLDFWKPKEKPEINSFFRIDESLILVGTSKGLFELNISSRTMTAISSETFLANKIFGTPAQIWVYSSEGGIFQLDKKYQLIEQIPSEAIKDINLSSLTVDSENRIWAGSLEKGLMVIENGKVQRFNYPELRNYTVRKINREENKLFLGTMGKGLLAFKPAKVTQLNYEELSEKNIKAIYQSEDSSIWVGTKANGLYQIKKGKILSWTEENGLVANSNTSISSHQGKLYFGTNAGISIIDMNSGQVQGQFTQENGLTSSYVHALYRDSKDLLWILARRGGIHFLDQEGKLHLVSLDREFENTRFVSALELSNGQILIGSMNQGLFWLENGQLVQHLPLPLPPGENVVYSIYEDQEKDLWLGTHGGLILLKNGEFKILNRSQGLKSKTVYSITDDGNRGVWISSNFGVQYLSKSDLQKFKTHQGEGFILNTYLFDQRLGMPNSETNGLIFPASLRDFSGKIWIPTVEGVGIIDPANLTLDPKEPVNFIWDELQIGDLKSSIEGKVVIPEGVRMFQISFNLIDLDNPSQYTLFYRIAGNGENWLPIKEQRQLYFNGLKPGDYKLEIKIIRFAEEEKVYTLPIQVTASFTETLAFKLILGLVFILLFYFLFMSYFNRKMKYELERKVVQRTRELSQTNEKLKNALNEIEAQNLVMKELTWNHSHLLRAPLTRAMAISHFLVNYAKYDQVEKSKEELELDLLNALHQVDRIVKDTHARSEKLKKNE